MASILRSGKIFRYIAGITRSVVFQSAREVERNFVQIPQCICSSLTNGYATNAPKSDLSIEQQLKRLDQDVRRTGRISRRDIEEVLEEIRNQRSATSSQSLLMIRCCGNLVPEELPEVRTALVQEIWNTLNSLNVPMDISHYNALLRVYLENEHPFSPTEFLSELESKAIEPNRVTYQRLILRYCQEGDINGATRILEYMREKNLPVNESVFNALILGHSQANDLDSAKSILTVMKQTGLEPSADTFTTLLCCYARHGDFDSIIQTIDECEKKEIFLLDKDIFDAIYELIVHGHESKIDPLLGKLRKHVGFNQDAVNIILRLVNKGYEDAGLKILRLMPRSTRPDGQPVDAGMFFIRQLIKANRPLEKIFKICKQLQDEGLNQKALLVATEASLSSGFIHTALPLLKEMKSSNLPIRQHYFWPLICSADPSNIITIVQQMQNEFNLQPSSETIRDYIIPKLKEDNPERLVNILTGAGIPVGTAASAVAFNALTKNKLADVAKILEYYRAYYPPSLFRNPLILALNKTNDYDSFIKIVRQIHDNLNKDNNSNQNHEEEPVAEDSESANNTVADPRAVFVGQIVNDAAQYFRTNRKEVLENILNRLVDQGLSMSSTSAAKVQERLGSELTPQLSELLEKMTAGDLEPVPLKSPARRKRTLDQLTIDELERYIETQEAKGENTNNIKRQLIATCFKTKNLDKTVDVINRLESDSFLISIGIWAQLIDMYTAHGRVDEAIQLYTKIKTKEPEFLLDNYKTVRIAELLLKSEKLEDAIAFLIKNKKASPHEDGEGTFNYFSTCWRLLNHVADAGNPEKLQTLFDTLVKNNYILPTNILLGPLVKVHLVRDDITKAMETFEKITETYKCTPWKNEIACRLIQKEDAANLQKLTDLSTNIHGEVNSLYDLVLSFVECGRIRQARKILETPGLRTRPKRIDYACERYKNEGLVVPLEGLIEATKDLPHIDRNTIYYNLLLSYAKTEDAEKALGLWTKMQDEGIAPTDAFLTELAKLLQKMNIDVPFATPPKTKKQTTSAKQSAQLSLPTPATPTVPESSLSAETPAANESESQPAKPKEPYVPTNLMLFRQAIKAGKVNEALELRRRLTPGEQPSTMDMSQLIECLTQAQQLGEATKYVFEMLEQGKRPVPRVFKFYLNKLAASGDVALVERIGKLINEEQKKLVSFDNRLCHAAIVAGKSEQYLKQLSDSIVNARTETEITSAANKFPRGGALGILEQNPGLLPQFEHLARKFAFKNLNNPMNTLWIYHSINGNTNEAKKIWIEFLTSEPHIRFLKILKCGLKQNNNEMIQNLIGQLIKNTKVSQNAIGRAYSCLLEIHCIKRQFFMGLETLNNALRITSIENLRPQTLMWLQKGIEESGKKFKLKIPVPYDEPISSDDDQPWSSSTSDRD